MPEVTATKSNHTVKKATVPNNVCKKTKRLKYDTAKCQQLIQKN